MLRHPRRESNSQAATEESMATARSAIIFLPNFIVLSFLVMGNNGTSAFVQALYGLETVTVLYTNTDTSRHGD